MELIPDLNDDLLEGLISGTSSQFRGEHQTFDFNLLCVHCCWLVVQLPANLNAINFNGHMEHMELTESPPL